MSEHHHLAEHTLRQCSDWVDWMKRELVRGGMELPGEDNCLRFVTQALDVVEQISPSTRLEQALETQLIEATILRLCWQRQLGLRGGSSNASRNQSVLLTLKAHELVRKINRDVFVVEASDDHQYAVRFLSPERKTRIGTEFICCEIASRIGLPVPERRTLLVNRNLAFRAGLPSRYCVDTGEVACFGLREPESGLRSLEEARHVWPLATHRARYLAGVTVVNVMTVNLIPEEPQYCLISGRAEPLFRDFSHALHDSDWERFVSARRPEPTPALRYGTPPWRYEQFEPWIRRVEQINLSEVCNLLLRAPAEWYGNNPFLVTDVIRKLQDRRRDLRRGILSIVKAS